MMKFKHGEEVLGELDVPDMTMLKVLSRLFQYSAEHDLEFNEIFDYILEQSLIVSTKYGRFLMLELDRTGDYVGLEHLSQPDYATIVKLPDDYNVELQIFNGGGEYIYSSSDEVFKNFIHSLIIETLVEYPQLLGLLEDVTIDKEGRKVRLISEDSVREALSYVDWDFIEKFFKRELNKLDKATIKLYGL